MDLTHSVRLLGIEPTHGLPGPLLRDLLDALDRGARGAVRLLLEGRSGTRGGQTPAWVQAAARFDMIGFTDDAPGVLLSAPRLADAIPERLAQYQLFEEVDASRSGLGVMERSLGEAVRGEEDSDAYDEGLLGTFDDLRRVFRQSGPPRHRHPRPPLPGRRGGDATGYALRVVLAPGRAFPLRNQRR